MHSAAPTALGISLRSIPQPFRAGLTFSSRPSGPWRSGELALSEVEGDLRFLLLF